MDIKTLRTYLKTIFYYRFVFRAIGRRSVIRRPILITYPRHITIGERVCIRDGARLEIVKDGVNQDPVLKIGSHTNIEQNVHIACHCRVIIGSHVSITANCAIVDISHPYEDVSDNRSISARLDSAPSFVEIEDYCFIGIGSVILPNIRIGHHSVIGANSVVTHDIPPFSIAAGNPAKVIRRYDHGQGLWLKVHRDA